MTQHEPRKRAGDLRRFKGAALAAAFLAALAGSVLTLTDAALAWRDNRAIDALVAGRDVPVKPSARFEVKFARAYFLLQHDRVDEAQVLVEEIAAGGEPKRLVNLHYDLANARLRAAFVLIEQGRIDAAASYVRLAKDGYRRALTIDPEHWDAKYNLDVAMRLVRDFPQMGAEVFEDTPRELPKRLWTDLPRLPRGLP